MFRNVVRCISLLRVEKVQEGLLAYAGSSFFVKKGCWHMLVSLFLRDNNLYEHGCVFIATSLRL